MGFKFKLRIPPMADSRPNWNSLKESQHPNHLYLRNISQSLDAKCGFWSYFLQCRLESLFNIAWQERSAICPGWMPASLPVLRKCFNSILCAETQLTRMIGTGIPRWYLFINLGLAWQTGKRGRRGENFWLMGTSLTNMSSQSLKQTLQVFCLLIVCFFVYMNVACYQIQMQTVGSPIYTVSGTLNSCAKINWAKLQTFLAIWLRIRLWPHSFFAL